ncbi:MAG: proton-conducting transporter membrane subunit [Elusimicrobia bacterium]|nr:proton-conducting transporter membrane subunit [Elusimicrobiota bacterium]
MTMIPMGSQAALVAGVLGTLSLGLMKRPPALALRALAVAAIACAMLFAVWTPSDVLVSPILLCDSKSIGWQYLIYLGALPLALWLDGTDDVMAALFLGSTLGMSLLAAAANLPMLFVALEFMSLPAYLLVARSRPGARGLEAAIKYFFAGGVAGALFMLGLAMYYADTRSLAGSSALTSLGQAGATLMAAAALFKLGAFPLNWWLPDVYEAAAPEVSGFLSTAMKSAAVLFLMRLCELAPQAKFAAYLPAVGAVTALVGSIMALRQERLQRLLAYSSVSNAGLLIIGVGAWAAAGRSADGVSAILFFLGAYAFMSNGTFAFLKYSGLETRTQLKGRGFAMPAAAAAFTILLFSLGGIPPTGGFMAKLLLLWRAVDAELFWPAASGALAALISLSYYLGMVRELWFEKADGPAPKTGPGASLVIACAVGVLLLGAAPWLMSSLSGALTK